MIYHSRKRMIDMKPFWKSRKFLIAMIDAGAGLLTLYVARFLQLEDAKLVISTFALLQPVLLVWIGSIAYEDGQALRAGVHPAQKDR